MHSFFIVFFPLAPQHSLTRVTMDHASALAVALSRNGSTVSGSSVCVDMAIGIWRLLLFSPARMDSNSLLRSLAPSSSSVGFGILVDRFSLTTGTVCLFLGGVLFSFCTDASHLYTTVVVVVVEQCRDDGVSASMKLGHDLHMRPTLLRKTTMKRMLFQWRLQGVVNFRVLIWSWVLCCSNLPLLPSLNKLRVWDCCKM